MAFWKSELAQRWKLHYTNLSTKKKKKKKTPNMDLNKVQGKNDTNWDPVPQTTLEKYKTSSHPALV